MERQTYLADLIPKEAVSPPPPEALDLTIPLQGGNLPVRIFMASEKSPKLFLFHAEGEKIDAYDALGKDLLQHDISLAVIGYRGANAGKGEASLESLFPDAREAFYFLEDHFQAHNRKGGISLLGKSLGAGVALTVAVEIQDQVQALILDSPIVDSKHWIKKRNLSWEGDPFAPLEKIQRWRKPLLIFVAQFDDELSLPEAEKLLIFSAGRNKRLLIMPGYHREETVERGGALYAETLAELLNRLAHRFKKRHTTH